MANRVMVAVLGLGLVAGAANAMSQWWTPSGAKCPVFNDEASCKAWCAADAKRCGGSAQCQSQTGEGPPTECNDEP